MSKRKISTRLLGAMVVAPILSMFLGGEPIIAQSSSPRIHLPGGCGITGAGTFNAQSKSVSAAGTFAYKIPNGTVVEAGVWTSNQLISFDVYGAAPNALRQRGIAEVGISCHRSCC